MSKSILVFLLAIASAALVAQPVSAGALTSVVTDPVGDAFIDSKPAPAFQDIVQTSIVLKRGQFSFVMDLAAPIPDRLSLHGGAVQLWWQWTLDTDPTTFPAGFPFAPTDARAGEFFVLLLWNGTSFAGIVIDRRPLLTGGEAAITCVPLSIKRTEVTVSLDSALLSNPSSFTWFSLTRDWFGPVGTESEFVVDFAPDFPGVVAWPP